MKLYTVEFKSNAPASVQETDVAPEGNVHMEFDKSNRTIKWITLFADDHHDAQTTADEIYQSIIGYL